ncbi:MAG TPA: IS5 family transposase [Oligoflexus sp.]|nr:IS5 family transposase [Oligoflexus sp.]HYX32189.1 IS5 family transposase [Oligoflexus sp.]
MTRRVLNDSIWQQLHAVMKAKGCHSWRNDREVMEAILWKLRTGAPWRDVPEEFCPWKTAYNRFNRWAAKGLWFRFFFELRGEIDQEWVFADGSYVRAHQHASGARLGEERAIGKSRGGATTKIHLAADAHGNPIDFKITGGEVHDAKAAGEIIEKIGEAEHFIADKGYDSEAIRDQARAAGMNPVIPRKSNSTRPNPEFDAHLYKMRHLVENLFAKLKHFRSIATRYEKLGKSGLGPVP